MAGVLEVRGVRIRAGGHPNISRLHHRPGGGGGPDGLRRHCGKNHHWRPGPSAGRYPISLFFVDPAWHWQGVGKAFFRCFLADSSAEKVTVHSSPYAVEIYRRLGFHPTASEQVADGIRYTPMVYAGAPQDEADISR